MPDDFVYLDYNATTPIHPEIWPQVAEKWTSFGNPSSVHWAGRIAKRILADTRIEVAKFIHTTPLELIFTSGGSEGNNMLLKGIALNLPAPKRRLVISSVEHPSVIKTARYLRDRFGFDVVELPVRRSGELDMDAYDQALTENTGLVSIQHVNNETGVIYPVGLLAKKAHKVGALFHSDMVQALGKIPVDVQRLDVDAASFAGHKFYAMKGAGFAFIKRGTHVDPLIHGGGQERSRRAGTENALALFSLKEAIRILGPQMESQNARLEKLRDQLQRLCLEEIPNSSVTSAAQPRVSNTLNVRLSDVDGETLLINLDTQGFAISSGAACSSGSQEPSPVLRAMGFSETEAQETLRISLGWLVTDENIARFFSALKKSVAQMRAARFEDTVHEAGL